MCEHFFYWLAVTAALFLGVPAIWAFYKHLVVIMLFNQKLGRKFWFTFTLANEIVNLKENDAEIKYAMKERFRAIGIFLVFIVIVFPAVIMILINIC